MKFNIKSELKQYCERSYFHGFAHTVRKDISRRKKWFWMHLIVLLLLLLIYLMGLRLTVYYSWKSVIEKDITYVKKLPFPAITICNANQNRLTMLYKYGMYDIMVNASHSKTALEASVSQSLNRDRYVLNPVLCELPFGESAYQDSHTNIRMSACMDICSNLVPQKCSGFLYDVNETICTLTSFTGERKVHFTKAEFIHRQIKCNTSQKLFIRRIRWTDSRNLHCTFDNEGESLATESCRLYTKLTKQKSEMWKKVHGRDYTSYNTYGRSSGDYLQMSAVHKEANLRAVLYTDFINTTGKCLRLHVNKDNPISIVSEDEELNQISLKYEKTRLESVWNEINVNLPDGLNKIRFSAVHSAIELVNGRTHKVLDEVTIADCKTFFCGSSCKDGQCLNADAECNGFTDCDDGSDENTCKYDEECFSMWDRVGSVQINQRKRFWSSKYSSYFWKTRQSGVELHPFKSTKLAHLQECEDYCYTESNCKGFLYTELLLNPAQCHLYNSHNFKLISNFTDQILDDSLSVYKKTVRCRNMTSVSLSCQFVNGMCHYNVFGGQTGLFWMTRSLPNKANTTILTLEHKGNLISGETLAVLSPVINLQKSQRLTLHFNSPVVRRDLIVWVIGSTGMFIADEHFSSSSKNRLEANYEIYVYDLNFCIPNGRQGIIIQKIMNNGIKEDFGLDSITVSGNCNFEHVKKHRRSLNESVYCSFTNSLCGFTALSEHKDLRWRVFPKIALAIIHEYTKRDIYQLKNPYEFYRKETYFQDMDNYENVTFDYNSYREKILKILDLQGTINYSNNSIASDIVHIVWIFEAASGQLKLQCRNTEFNKRTLAKVSILDLMFVPSSQFYINNKAVTIMGTIISVELFLFRVNEVRFTCDYQQIHYQHIDYVAALLYDGTLTERTYTMQFISPVIDTSTTKCFTLRYVLNGWSTLKVTRNDSDGTSRTVLEDYNHYKKNHWRVRQIKLFKKIGTAYVIIHSQKSSMGTYENPIVLDSVIIDEACACPNSSFECDHGDNKCIDISQKCDHYKDCSDYSDEPYNVCSRIPLADKFFCGEHSSRVRMLNDKLCDGVGDCRNNYDEKPCMCFNDRFYCHNGECLDGKGMTIGKPDCSDGTDENGNVLIPLLRCNSRYNSAPYYPQSAVEIGVFTCPYINDCIEKSSLCDGIEQCKSGADESTIGWQTCPCHVGYLSCDSHCVPFNMRCDKWSVCSNYKDEDSCTIFIKLSEKQGYFHILGNEYVNYLDYQWDITVEDGKVVILSIHILSIQHHSQCLFDSLTVNDYVYRDYWRDYEIRIDNRIAILCSANETITFQSTSNTISVRFVSDSSITAQGFSATYTTALAHNFSELFTSNTGSFSTPNYPYSFFYARSMCDSSYMWNITIDPELIVSLKLHAHISKQIVLDIWDQLPPEPLLTLETSQNEKTVNTSILSASNFVIIELVPISYEVCVSDPLQGFTADYVGISPSCSAEIEAGSGKIFSPNFPHNYRNGEKCQWNLLGGKHTTFTLTVDVLQIEYHSQCQYDALAVYDRTRNESILLAKVCAQMTNVKLFSSSNEMIITFSSDEVVSGVGFTMYYSTVNTSSTFINLAQSENNVHNLINSENYRSMNKEHFHWIIHSKEGTLVVVIVQITILQFYEGCQHEAITVYDKNTIYDASGHVQDYFFQIANLSLCETTEVLTFQSNGNNMRIDFQMFSAITGNRFSANSTYISENSLQSYYSRFNSGSLSTPNYPYAFYYRTDRACDPYVWSIIVERDLVIILHIIIQVSKHIAVLIQDYNGNQNSEYSLYTVATFKNLEKEVHTSLISSRSWIGINVGPQNGSCFQYDGQFLSYIFSQPIYGFTLIYNDVHDSCFTKINQSVGNFSSRNFPYKYRNNELCAWHIFGDEGVTLMLTLHILEIEHETNCNNDFITVYENLGNETHLLGRYCTSNTTVKMFSTSNEMIVNLVTNDAVVGTGFTAYFEAVNTDNITASSKSSEIIVEPFNNNPLNSKQQLIDSTRSELVTVNLINSYQNLFDAYRRILYSSGKNLSNFLYESSQFDYSQILKCDWDKGVCLSSLTSETLTDVGSCIVINSEFKELFAEDAGTGLTLLIDTEPIESVEHMNENGGGVIVYVHDQNELPQIQNLGTHISAGNSVVFKLNYHRHVLQLPKYGTCGSKQLHLYPGVEYTRSHCLAECEALHMFETCQCVLPQMPQNTSMQTCTFPQYIYCALDALLNSSKCECPGHCDQSRFDIQLSYSKLSERADQSLANNITSKLFAKYNKQMNLKNRFSGNIYAQFLKKMQLVDESIFYLQHVVNSEMEYLLSMLVKCIEKVTFEIDKDVVRSKTGLKFEYSFSLPRDVIHYDSLDTLRDNINAIMDQYISDYINKQNVTLMLLSKDSVFAVKNIIQTVNVLVRVQTDRGVIGKLYLIIENFKNNIANVYNILLEALYQQAVNHDIQNILDISKFHVFRMPKFNAQTLDYKFQYSEEDIENFVLKLGAGFQLENGTYAGYEISSSFIELLQEKKQYQHLAENLVSSLNDLVDRWLTLSTIASQNVIENANKLEHELQTFQNNIDFQATMSKTGLVELQFLFENLKIETFKQQIAYSIFTFFSDTGGFLGLLLGATALSLVEILDMMWSIVSRK